ncbi:LLM class flavin-dependent oxidoreductase [Sphingomonas bacterium]|uniref:LLM class flavin-dependent oxidoreductase n=1 Tax=Sphingomonas bacterium TaxID=1895847 RepID=UPI001C2D4E03|nr:LLM class flavin-dependent oxidoreductase [Sphingomonas bacterium]
MTAMPGRPAPAARRPFEIGFYTLSELTTDPATGRRVGARQRIDETIAVAKLADEAGLDVFGLGEHRRLDYAVPSPMVVLAAIAEVTTRIRLSTAVTVLGATDPVRLYEDAATLNLVSAGRAELMLGRGAFAEPFALAGIANQNYDSSFIENYQLFEQLQSRDRVTWSGSTRPPLRYAEIAPRPVQSRIPAWIAVGGSAASAQRAGHLGARMMLAALGGPASNAVATVAAYRAAGAAAGHPPNRLRVGLATHAYVGQTAQSARNEFYPAYTRYWAEALGSPAPLAGISRRDLDRLTTRDAVLMVGSPAEIVDKILYQHALLDHNRYLAQLDIGAQPFAQVARTIERLATEVAPQVRTAVAAARSETAAAPRGEAAMVAT